MKLPPEVTCRLTQGSLTESLNKAPAWPEWGLLMEGTEIDLATRHGDAFIWVTLHDPDRTFDALTAWFWPQAPAMLTVTSAFKWIELQGVAWRRLADRLDEVLMEETL